MKGILDKAHKLQFLATSEPDETIAFPGVKRRLLQFKEEGEATFAVPTIDKITEEIVKAKQDATKICSSCRIQLQSYTDLDLVQHVQDIIEDAVTNDHECEDNSNTCSDDESINTIDENSVSPDDVVTIQEDLSQLRVVKSVTSSFPVYEKVTDKVTDSSVLQEGSKEKPWKKTYSLQGVSKKSRAKSKEKPRPLPFSPELTAQKSAS